MTLKATQKRARIAAVLARSERLGWNPPTAREIGDICGERNSSDWAHGPLRDIALMTPAEQDLYRAEVSIEIVSYGASTGAHGHG